MVYGYYILHQLRRFPREYRTLSFYERAEVAAYIDEKQRRDRIQAAKQKMSGKKGGSGGKKPARRRR